MTIKSSHQLVEEASASIQTLSAEEVLKLEKDKQISLIDVRDIRELWKEGTIENSIHIPRGMLEFWLDPNSQYYNKNKFAKDKKLILFCAAGMRSALAAKTLKDMGYNNIAHAEGGFGSLANQGLEIVIKEKK